MKKSILILIIAIFQLIFVSGQLRIPVNNDGNENPNNIHISHIASLQDVRTETSFFCIASFISPKALLTLATCFYQNDILMEPHHVRVVAGSQFRDDEDLIRYSTYLEDIIIHPNFSRSSLEGNLAIGILTHELPDNDSKLGFIDIEDFAYYSPIPHTKCKIYGWSLTTRGERSPHLLSGDVEIEDISACDTTTNKITSTTICAGPYHVNGCETDDGGPVICNNKVVGLIDYRPEGYCSRIITNRLGTYVDIAAYHDWIIDNSSGVDKHVFNILLLCFILLIKIIL